MDDSRDAHKLRVRLSAISDNTRRQTHDFPSFVFSHLHEFTSLLRCWTSTCPLVLLRSRNPTSLHKSIIYIINSFIQRRTLRSTNGEIVPECIEIDKIRVDLDPVRSITFEDTAEARKREKRTKQGEIQPIKMTPTARLARLRAELPRCGEILPPMIFTVKIVWHRELCFREAHHDN